MAQVGRNRILLQRTRWGRRLGYAALGYGLLVMAAPTVGRAATLNDSMYVTIRTGGDNLRNSSHAYISTLRADGTWSSDYRISNTDPTFWCDEGWGSGGDCWEDYLYPNTTCHFQINGGWDGLDPCATQVRIRMTQGACAFQTTDNWSIGYVQVSYTPFATNCAFQMASTGSARLTGSSPSFTFNTLAAPPGTTCKTAAKTVDCAGHQFFTSVLTASPPFDKDGWCDDGSTGFNFMCEEFLFDSGACGQPAQWPADCGGYYEDGWCDCNDCGGVWDPDCNNPNINSPQNTVYYCDPGQVCVNESLACGAPTPTCVTPSGPVR